MATYKVIQDIEAEDKLLGPLTFRQFIYALICAFLLFLTWFVGRVLIFMIPVFLVPAAGAAFFAFPWRRDQPTELWALAKIRYKLKPHKRIWNQSGAKELVTITAPKKIQTTGRNLSQREVKSRLHALADTLDSRGWAIKGPATTIAPQPAFAGGFPGSGSDRLVAAQFQAPSDDVTVTAADDMMDEKNNPRAQRMNSLIEKSTKERRDKVVKEMNQPQQEEKPRDRWFMNQPGGATSVPSDQVTFNTQVVSPQGASAPQQTQQAAPPTVIPNQPTAQQPANPVDEDELVKELEARKQESPIKSYYGHLRTILPMAEQKRMAAAKAQEERQKPKPAPVAKKPPAPEQSPEKQATLRQLATNNDLNVATLAREAKRADTPPDEVVINLH